MSTKPPYVPPGTDPTGNPRPPKNPPPQPATAPKGDDGEIKRYQDQDAHGHPGAVDPLDPNLEGRN